jgi:hypothetical protein
MATRPDQQDSQHPARDRAAARFAREEVADVLAEGLWALLCAGRWPGSGGDGGAPPAATVAAWRGGADTAQPVETTGV